MQEHVMKDIDELRALAQEQAPCPGRHESALSGLWFYRQDEPVSKNAGRVNCLAVALVLQGKKQVTSGNKDYFYAAGDYLLITQAKSFEASVLEASRQRPYFSVSLEISPELVVKTLSRLKGENFQNDAPVENYHESFVVQALNPRLASAFLRLVQSTSSEADRRALSPLIRAEIAYYLLTSPAANQLRAAALRRGDDTQIAEAIDYIRRHYHRKLTVEELSSHVAMSASHFAHRFKAVARVSPMKYLKQVRLEAARNRLLTRGESASSVAYQVGYASPSHFSRDFSQHFGQPPGEYTHSTRMA